jgi:hypothetical protein
MDTKVFSTIDKQQLHDLFYSDLFKELRGKYYKAAYEQGRFDEFADTTNGYPITPPPMKQIGSAIATITYNGELPIGKER